MLWRLPPQYQKLSYVCLGQIVLAGSVCVLPPWRLINWPQRGQWSIYFFRHCYVACESSSFFGTAWSHGHSTTGTKLLPSFASTDLWGFFHLFSNTSNFLVWPVFFKNHDRPWTMLPSNWSTFQDFLSHIVSLLDILHREEVEACHGWVNILSLLC